MEENEDLHENIFFIALKGKYKNTYLQAEKNCYFICIPSNKCLLNNQDITQDDIDTHILVPSPFIMGEYITLNGKTLEIDNSNVITKKGFDQNRTAKILFEELFYNKDYKKFTVVCIDKPLQGKLNQKKTQETDELNLPPPNKRTFNECEKFLYSFPENELVLKKIEEYIKSFCKNYFIVKGFEHHSKKKAEELIERASDDLLCVNVIFRKAYNLNKNFDDLQLVIENFVMGKLSEKVYGTIGDIYTKEDDETFKAINSSQSLQKTDVGVTEAFLDLNLENPIKLFQTMQNAITPLDKLFILKETIQAINNEASNLNISVGSDDLLPLLVYIVLQSNSKKIHSSFLYMENFLFFDFDTNEIGFNLISFKAACSYIQNDPVIKKLKEKKYPPVEQKSNNVQVFSMNMFSSSDSKLKPQRTSNVENTSHKSSSTSSIYNENNNKNNYSKSENNKLHRSKTEFFGENIMIDFGQTNNNLVNSNNNKNVFKHPPTVIDRSNVKEDGLGDFLNSLVDDSNIISSNQMKKRYN